MFPSRRIVTSGGDSFRDEYSLEFDGTDDSVLTAGDDTAADATYVWWMKSNITGKNRGVFGHGSQNRGAFHLNYNNSNPLWFRGGSNYRYWDDTSAQDDGQWHQWVVVNDHSDITACKLYIDGIEQSVSTDPATVSSGSVTAYSTNLCIGADVDGTNHFVGNISEFAWYDIMLTDGQIKTIYNSRESYNNKEGVASANLKGWWRMGDGSLDDRNSAFEHIGDETNPTLGAELITNGGFDTDSNWTVSSGTSNNWAIAGGTINHTDDGSDDTVQSRQSGVGVVGKIYKVSFDITAFTSGSVHVDLGDTGTGVGATRSAVGSYSEYLMATGTFVDIEPADGTVLSVDNVSVRLVGGNSGICINMAAEDFTGDTP